MKFTFFVSFLVTLIFLNTLSAQNVTGEWYGVGKVKKAGDHNSYLSEMILKQKGNKLTGEFNYYYRSVEIKTKITGTYNPKFKVIELNARPILNFLAKNANGADCPMEGSFTLKITATQQTLTGQFNPTYDYRITCPAIDVKFTKSDPTKPKPQPKEIALTPPTKKIDTLKKVTVITRPIISQKPITLEQRAEIELRKRSFDVSPIYEVDANSLEITLYDNGEVDNDTISVFLNRQLLKYKQGLSDKPYRFTVSLDTAVKEISMFAENLGRIPPNTALAIIYAGEKRFELNLTSTYLKNAAIRFKRKIKRVDPKNIN